MMSRVQKGLVAGVAATAAASLLEIPNLFLNWFDPFQGVIASMIGAGGLGYQVLQGIQRLEVSRGLLAGVGIVLMAIIFDRIAQGYGQRVQRARKQES